MPNYRESQTSAISWRRAFSGVIHNPLPGSGEARIDFTEQDVITADGKVIGLAQVFDFETVSVAFDPAGVIALRDPESGKLTGQTMTHLQLRAALHSLYMIGAQARDERAAAATAAQAAIQQPSGN